MKYTLIVKERAKAEIEEIASDYEKKREGLGYAFWEAAETALHDITANPLGYAIKYEVYRTKLIRPFPFLLIFEVKGTEIIVYQCYAGRSDPAKKYGYK
ncbi:MAG: hypothetical protein KF900_01230 [Bacteroidetes bacterium]|nr:hypothetical protein [Bacteroidota bacterium]